MKVHLVAIGGTGMGSVAGLLVEAGHEVRGSDGPIYPPMSTLLTELGIKPYEGYAAQNLDWNPDLVVLGNTCRKDNVEYAEAQRWGLEVVSFPQLLATRFLPERHPIVVTGTHGKTTTTSLVAQVLSAAGTKPGFFIGGIPANFGRGYALGQPPYFVLEGDEYDTACFDKRPKFLHYRTQTLVLTGVEFDHADIYADLEAIKRAFSELIERMPADGLILVCAHCELAVALCADAPCTVARYAVGEHSTTADLPEAEWVGRFQREQSGQVTMEVSHGSTPFGAFSVPLHGRHNMQNALAAIGVAHSAGIDAFRIAAGLDAFSGVARRQQVRGVVNGITVIDDFAHHPTAVKETLLALRNVHGTGRLIAVWEPRSSTSRRAVFQDDWPVALAAADQVVIAPLFEPKKIPEAERLDLSAVARSVEAKGRTATTLEIDQIASYLQRRCQTGDTVVVMSSGGFGGIIEQLLEAFRNA